MTREELQEIMKNKPIYKQGHFVVIINKDYYEVYCQVNNTDDFEFIQSYETEPFISPCEGSSNKYILGAEGLIQKINVGEVAL